MQLCSESVDCGPGRGSGRHRLGTRMGTREVTRQLELQPRGGARVNSRLGLWPVNRPVRLITRFSGERPSRGFSREPSADGPAIPRSCRPVAVGAGFEQAVLLPFLPEVLARDPQNLRGPLNVAVHFAESGADVLPLGLDQRQALGDLDRIFAWLGPPCPRGPASCHHLEAPEW